MGMMVAWAGMAASPLDPLPNGDRIPDFSTVGYHHGDAAIPKVPVVATVEAPSDGGDATKLIQQALDSARAPGAVLLKSGTYKLDGTIAIRRSGIVLRGEGPSTKLVATARRQYTLISVGGGKGRVTDRHAPSAAIVEERVPVGRTWVAVDKPQLFKVGDRVCIYRPGTDAWIHDLAMDRIPPRRNNGKVSQWTPRRYNLNWEREVRRVDGKRVFFDAPVVMALEAKYGGGRLVKCESQRTTECGVEDLLLESEFDPNVKDRQGRWVDEQHAWTAVGVGNAENCWVRNLTSRHFGYGLVSLNGGARLCTVENCQVEMPVSVVTGGRRYGLNMGGCEMCLIRDCSVENDRHGCVTGACVCGPNVFLRCTGKKMWSDFGPHHRWATGCLYDNVKTSGQFNVQDRGNCGSGHGWAGANFVLWNCEAGSFACQSPWVSAQNWSVGCVGPTTNHGRFKNSAFDHADGRQRPDCVRISPGKHVSPASLYEKQLSERMKRRKARR